MAQNLLKAGFELTVHNRSRGVVAELAGQGARPAATPAEVAAQTDMVLTCLPDVATVEQVYLAAEGLVQAARPGQVLVDHSTVGPATSRTISEAAQARGVAFLDAPISGGVERAQDATLTIMVGGPSQAFDRALPVLEAMGERVHHMGPSGAGSITKLLNQLLVTVHSAAAAEALVLAQASGVDQGLVLEVLSSSWGASNMLVRNGPVTVDRAFDGARAPLKFLVKDLGLALELARQLGVSLPQGQRANDLLDATAEQGLLELDVAALVLPLEKAAKR
jgi:3-hydroxyisobutyrate dehydrogenase-like beta-hydroxyacid dehydrogenase